MSLHSMSSALMLLLTTAAAAVTAQEALSAWNEGVATNYGGSSEGKNADTASYGLQDVSNLPGAQCMQSYAAICSSLQLSPQAVGFALYLSGIALFLHGFLIMSS